MNDRGGWDVLDTSGQSLFHSDKLRAQGHARRRFALEGGTVTLVSRTGEELTEYAVVPWSGRPAAVRSRWRRHFTRVRRGRRDPQH